MLRVDCAALSEDEKLALAAEISDTLEGRALALVQKEKIVIDELSEAKTDVETLRPIVLDFISRRKDPGRYSLEVKAEEIYVHSSDPLPIPSRRETTLPPNLKQCPMCSFITQYEEEYTVHVRSHYFGV